MFFNSTLIKPNNKRICVRKGEVTEGKLIGCNLNSILNLAGTEYFPNFNNSILFIEAHKCNINLAVRNIQTLKNIGVFNKINGIVIGYIYGFEDSNQIKINNINIPFEKILLDLTKEFDFPIIKTTDFGHNCPNCFLPIGITVRLNSDNCKINITEKYLL